VKIKLPLGLGKLWIVISKGQALHAKEPFHTKLIVRKFIAGQLISEQDLGEGLVTDVGVRLLAADWINATATLKLMNYHDTGTGTLTPSVADTVMQIPTGTSRGVGNQSNTANVYQSVANVTFGGTFLVTEWGIFSAAASGTMFDHRTWAGTHVDIGNILQFVWQLSVLSGG
jgi:hypothetical protein